MDPEDVMTFISNHAIESIISFERHPMAVAVIVFGISILPLVSIFYFT